MVGRRRNEIQWLKEESNQIILQKGKVMKKIAVMCLMVAFCLVFSTIANAGNYVCKVDMVGPAGATATIGTRIYLTDTSSSPAWAGSKVFKVPVQQFPLGQQCGRP
jgi:hypothetical protein